MVISKLGFQAERTHIMTGKVGESSRIHFTLLYSFQILNENLNPRDESSLC